MEAPSKEKLDSLKAKHSDRQLYLVELQKPGEDDVHCVVMQGANADEYKLISDQISNAREAKSEIAKNDAMMFAGKNAVLRLTVWPDREEMVKFLFDHPGFIEQLQDKIREQMGATAEVRSKKL